MATENPRSSIWHPIIAALLLTVLNAFKPLTIDDTAFYLLAEIFADQPLRPYSGLIFWFDAPEPAINITAPPVFLYWFAGAITLFGDSPFLWKLALFPIIFLLAKLLQVLGRYFAPGCHNILMWFVMFSPAVLPAVNLMIDIPALTVGLGAVALFRYGIDHRSTNRKIVLVLAAGLLAGLAMQTKYTGISAVAGMAAFALVGRSYWSFLAGATAAAVVFLGWEGFIYSIHGTSKLWQAFLFFGAKDIHAASRVLLSFITIFGVLAIALLPLVISLATGRILLVIIALIGSFLLLLSIALYPPVEWRGHFSNFGLRSFGQNGVLGLLAWGAVIWAVAMQSLPSKTSGRRLLSLGRGFDPLSTCLLLWLGAEIVITFVISPFPAARRFEFLFVICCLLVGRSVAYTSLNASAYRRPATLATIGSAIAGLFVWAVDVVDARTERDAALRGAGLARAISPNTTHWFLGHWGFQFYALSAGLRPLVPGKSTVNRGDLLVVPARLVDLPNYRIEKDRFVVVRRIWVGANLPWTVKMGFYGTTNPVLSLRDHRIPVVIYRAKVKFVPGAK